MTNQNQSDMASSLIRNPPLSNSVPNTDLINYNDDISQTQLPPQPSFRDDWNDEMSLVRQNFTLTIDQLDNRNAHLENVLEQVKNSNRIHQRENERLSAELQKAHEEIFSLKNMLSANEQTNWKLKQENVTITKLNTTLNKNFNLKCEEWVEASDKLADALDKNKKFETIIEQLENNKPLKSGDDNAKLEKEKKRRKKYAIRQARELKDVEYKLEDAKSRIKDLNRENKRLSAKLDRIVEEESERQAFYENSYLAKFLEENEEEEERLKRRADEANLEEICSKKRKEDINPICDGDGQQVAAYMDQDGMNLMDSTRGSPLEYDEMPKLESGKDLVETDPLVEHDQLRKETT